MLQSRYGFRTSYAVLVTALLGHALAAHAQPLDEASLEGLALRSIGPAVMGGRIDDVAVVEDRPWILYVGAASGGLWKSTNSGTTWTPLFDDQVTASIGDIALAPSDPETVWVGTGEPNHRQSSTHGHGVYRSLDGGATWWHAGLADTHHIGRIVIHPRDPATVFVAALGHLWGPNDERGVFRTTDAGKTWENVLFIDEDTGVNDVAMDPANPRILYAAAYQRRRTPWGFSGGGPGSALYRSTDAGDTWSRLTEGLPEGPLGRIGLDIHRDDPRIVYALVQARDGGTFRSEDRGEHWTRVNELNPRPMYYSHIRVDPRDARRVYVLGAPFYASNDGGTTFARNTKMSPSYDAGVHGDHHSLWIDPANGDHLILAGDGGLYISWDRGSTWDKINNIPLAQFYGIAVDMQSPYLVYGGAQDTHSWGGPSATRTRIGILNDDWFQINFGDGMYQAVDPSDARIVYTESQGGNIVRLDRATGDRKVIKPHPAPGEEPYRFHWTAPIALSPHDPATIYLGGNRLFVSNDRGENWTATEDLTRAEDRDVLPIMGVVPDGQTLSRHDGTSAWGTITTVSESPMTAGVIYIGTDDGRVQLSRDDGTTWQAMDGRFPGLDEERSLVSRVVASSTSPGRAYATFDRHRLDDMAPYVFTTDDYGRSWRSITSDLPASAWVNVIVEHARAPTLLFVGTETGLFVSVDRGAHWTPLRGNFPTVPVDDLVIHPRDDDLVVGTHGRGIYILDDLAPLRALASGDRLSDAQLFEPRPAVQYVAWKHESCRAQREFVGANPPYGASLTYLWPDDPDGPDDPDTPDDAEPSAEPTVTIAVVNADGRVVRDIDASPTHRGMNRVVWDLRSDRPEALSSGRGPLVPAGRYTASLTARGKTHEQPILVEMDPDSAASTEEHQARYDFLTQINAQRARLQQATRVVDHLVVEIDRLQASDRELPDDVTSQIESVDESAGTIRDAIQEGGGGRRSLVSQANSLFGELDGDNVRQGTLSGPTHVQQVRLTTLTSEIDASRAQLDRLIAEDVERLNRALAEAGLVHVTVTER